MQDNFLLYKNLQMVRALNITAKQGKRQELPLEDMVGQHLKDGEEIYFRVESMNFWLKVNFKLSSTTCGQVEGNIELWIDKGEKLAVVKKKLQILMIKLWAHSIKQRDMFFMLDKFEVASLLPPAEDSVFEPFFEPTNLDESKREMLSNQHNSSAMMTESQYQRSKFSVSS